MKKITRFLSVYAVIYCISILSVSAQWSDVSFIRPFFTDDFIYGSGGNTVYHKSEQNRRFYLYNSNYGTINSSTFDQQGILSWGTIYSHFNDTLYTQVRLRKGLSLFTFPAIMTDNLNATKIIDTINEIALDGIFLDMVFHNSRYGVIRTRTGNFITTDGTNSWRLIDSTIYHFDSIDLSVWSSENYSINGNGFMAKSTKRNGASFLIYSNDYGQNFYDKILPNNFELATIIDAANHVYLEYDSTRSNTRILHFSNDTGSTFYRVDTFANNINYVKYIMPQNADSFLLVLTQNGSFYFSKSDGTWKLFDNFNFTRVNIYDSRTGHAYNPELVGNTFFKLIELPTSLPNPNELNNGLFVYPNPAMNSIHLRGDIISITVIDLKGISKNLQINSSTKTCDISSLGQGIYFLYVQDKNGSIHKTKLVITR